MDDGQKAIVCEIVDDRMEGVPKMIRDVIDQEIGKFTKQMLGGLLVILFAIAGAWFKLSGDVSHTQQSLVVETLDRKEADANMQKSIDERLNRIEDGIDKITNWFINNRP